VAAGQVVQQALTVLRVQTALAVAVVVARLPEVLLPVEAVTGELLLLTPDQWQLLQAAQLAQLLVPVMLYTHS
jgi:hypothetical protein